ncbi:hypothetical protein BFF78_15790 [Streptomyces fodineus]|uniref:Thioester reductase n=1 Tax=Streptomyces fodineus TaxID=1904616 RepID=A0A1D7Y9N2_9ACTN|nr:amino acid adenylation domain-containing protein [Streptomyces fodineus]AOR32337.1 hypothetical protein BFF78_15790 [Streptomyces fodineus]
MKEVAGPADRLDALIRRQAARTPDAIAVRGPGGELTYRGLIAEADAAAARLAALGAGPESVVAVRAERSVELVVTLLGILSAGAAYLPLAVDCPPLRTAHMLAEAGVTVAVADPAYAADLTAAAPVSVLGTDGTAGPPPPAPLPVPEGHTGDGLAYVIYTSGSTGRPKGVAIEHRGIVRRLLWMQETFPIGPGDVVLQKTPYTFDVSVWEFFWPLLTGARLVLAEPGRHGDPEYLAEVIRKEAVTALHFVPSMFSVFLDEPGLPECRTLRRVFCSGELLPAALANRFRSLHPAELHNLYGPTEASVDVTHWPCRPVEPGDAVPIGHPMPHVGAYVLGEDRRPVPAGAAGELYLGGIALARGYIGRPDLTAERFVTVPDVAGGARLYRTGDLVRQRPDGALEFLGRTDHQVKLNGVRIEPGEIEAVLRECPGVRDAAVIVRHDMGSAPRLAAYVFSGRGGGEPDRAVLGARMRERLSGPLLPAFLTVMSEPPVTANGKLDRSRLPRPDRRADRW